MTQVLQSLIYVFYTGIRIFLCQFLVTVLGERIAELPALAGIHPGQGVLLLMRTCAEMGLLLLLYRFFLSRYPFTSLRPGFYKAKWMLLLTAAGVALFLIMMTVVTVWWLAIDRSFVLNTAMTPHEKGLFIAKGLILGTRGAFVEELLYRGYYQQFVANRLGVTASVLFPAIAFGIIHMVGTDDWPDRIWRCLEISSVGVFYGVISHRFGSFWYSSVIHYCWNSTFFLPWIYGQCEAPEGEFLIRTFIFCDSYMSHVEVHLLYILIPLLLGLVVISWPGKGGRGELA